MQDLRDTIYHIYAKTDAYNCLNEEQFEDTWEMLKVMVGILKTDYTESTYHILNYRVKLVMVGLER